MQIKKIIALAIVQIVILAAAAFGGGSLKDIFNTQIKAAKAAGSSGDLSSPVAVYGITGDSNEQTVSIINFLPSPELPARPPDAMGTFGGFDGSWLTVQQSIFMTVGAAGESGVALPATGDVAEPAPAEAIQSGVVIVSNEVQDGTPITGTIVISPVIPAQTTPLVVQVTAQTLIYHDVAQIPSGEGVQTIQQMLEPGSLAGLNEMVVVTVWGHMEGNVLVADVILYQTPIVVQ